MKAHIHIASNSAEKTKLWLLSVAVVCFCLTTRHASAAQLLFKSNFEPDVIVTAPYKGGSQWKQDLTGRDNETGYTWPDDLSNSELSSRLTPMFLYLVGRDANFSNFIETRIETLTGPNGASTQALYQEVKGDDPNFTSLTRSEYCLYPHANLDQAYIRYWLKLQPDYLATSNSTSSNWRMLMEWKEPATLPGTGSSDYRWGIYMVRDSGTVYWQLKGEQVRPTRQTDWVINTQVEIPIGEWALIEIFWRHHRTNGRLWMSVNGELVGDHQGRNAHPTKDNTISYWAPFKVYCGGAFFREGYSAYQWIDDVEIWDDIPPGKPNCGDNSCEGPETCSSCPEDCGNCAPPAAPEGFRILDR